MRHQFWGHSKTVMLQLLELVKTSHFFPEFQQQNPGNCMGTIITIFFYKGKLDVLFCDLDLNQHLPQHLLCHLLSSQSTHPVFDRNQKKHMVYVQKDTVFFFEKSVYNFEITNHCVAHQFYLYSKTARPMLLGEKIIFQNKTLKH